MRTVKFRHLYGEGESSSPWENECLDKFIFHAPELAYMIAGFKVMPPFAVLNDFFNKKESNMGMSGAIEWKPFEIDEKEYQDLVDLICTDPLLNVELDEIYSDMSEYKHWQKKAMSEYNPRKRDKS